MAVSLSPRTRASSASTSGRRPASDAFLIGLIVILAPAGQVATDIYTPSLPHLVEFFGTSRTAVQLSVSLYMAAFAVGQLLYGPLAEARGRKPALVVGFCVFLVGDLLCMFSHGIGVFIAGRILQGLGISTGPVVMKVIAADRFAGKRLADVMTYMIVAYGLGPIVAPVIGAQFQAHLSWQYSLYFMGVYVAALLVLVLGPYKETAGTLVPFRMGRTLRDARVILSSPVFLANCMAMGLIGAILFSFNLVAPFLVENVLHDSSTVFGMVALAMGACYMLGSLTNRILPVGFTPRNRLRVASSAAVVCSGAMLALGLTCGLSLWSLAVPAGLLLGSGGLMYPNLVAGGMRLFPDLPGLTSSLQGFFLMLLSSAVMVGSSYMRATSMLPMSVTLLVCSVGLRLCAVPAMRAADLLAA